MAVASCSRSKTAADIWNRATRFRSRMPSLPNFASCRAANTTTMNWNSKSTITGLRMARAFGWLWMDPLAGFIGALVIANWSVGLLRDTGGILLDRTPDPRMAERVRMVIESEGDQVTDLHLWRLGPGHLGAIVSVATTGAREAAHYRQRLTKFADLSHVTVEVQHSHSAKG